MYTAWRHDQDPANKGTDGVYVVLTLNVPNAKHPERIEAHLQWRGAQPVLAEYDEVLWENSCVV